MTKSQWVARSLLAVLCSWAIGQSSFGVDLIVRERLGIPRSRYPVEVEAPFAKGALKDPKSLCLSNPRGERVPFQAEATQTWGDGSVQRLRVNFLVDITAEGSAVYRLTESQEAANPPGAGSLRVPPQAELKAPQSGAAPPPPAALQVVEKPDLYQVMGGDLQLGIAKNLPGMLGSVQVSQEEFVRPGASTLTVRKGALEVEAEAKGCVPKLDSSGPLRASFACEGEVKYLMSPKGEGRKGGFFGPRPETIGVRVRLERPGAQPWVRLTYSFARSLQDVWVRVGHRFNLGGGSLAYDLCGYNKFSGSLGPNESVTLARDEALRPWPMPMWAVTSGADYSPDKLLLRGFVPPGRMDRKMETAGWGVLSGKERAVVVGFHDFWSGGLKRISLGGNGTVVIGMYLRPMFNLPMVSSEQDRWATATVTYAFFAEPVEHPEAAARAIVAGLEVRCPADYYASCGVKPPPRSE